MGFARNIDGFSVCLSTCRIKGKRNFLFIIPMEIYSEVEDFFLKNFIFRILAGEEMMLLLSNTDKTLFKDEPF